MDTWPPLTQTPRPTWRLSFGTIVLLIMLIGVIGGGILSLFFLREIKTVLHEYSRSVGACTTHTRTLQETGQDVLTRIDFAYPCGWHVIERPLVRDAARRGVVSDYLYVNPDPVSLAPRGGEAARIIVRVDEQDASTRFTRMRSLQQYITAEQKDFVKQTTTTLTQNVGGITFTKIDGTQNIFNNVVPVVVYYAELHDKTQPERRMILRIWSANPKWEDGTVEKALNHIVETLKQI